MSGVIGLWIIATDAWLWAVAPDHAYGLIAFVGLDAILAAALWRVSRPAIYGLIAFALVQVLAMAGDILLYRPPGVPGEAWTAYLLSNASFMSLLAVKLAVTGMAVAAVTGISSKVLRRV